MDVLGENSSSSDGGDAETGLDISKVKHRVSPMMVDDATHYVNSMSSSSNSMTAHYSISSSKKLMRSSLLIGLTSYRRMLKPLSIM
jgi:hypothetical protein